MADEIERREANEQAPKPKNDWWVRLLNYCKRKLQERRAQKEKQTPTDRAAQSTANASWIMAGFTAVIAFVGFAQWAVIRAQLDEMRSDTRLTEAMLDNPVWLSGIKSFEFSDPKFGGIASVDVVLKNAGKQLGIIELLVVSIETKAGLNMPAPSIDIPRHDAGCIDLVLGEVTLLAGDERTLHMICFPKLKPEKIAATLASKQFTFVRVFLIYYDRRRIAYERSTMFLYRPPHAGTKDAHGGFVSLGSRELEVPESQTSMVEEMQRRSYTKALELDLDIEKQVQKK